MGDLELITEAYDLGGRQVTLWRPSQPRAIDDPDAERGLVGPVWAQTWTSGVVLARIVGHQALRGVRVLELGCGLGLVGLAAASAGARVTVSDGSRTRWPSRVVDRARHADHGGERGRGRPAGEDHRPRSRSEGSSVPRSSRRPSSGTTHDLAQAGRQGRGRDRQRARAGVRLKYSNPMSIDDVAADFPELRIILAHPSFPWRD